MSIRERYDLSRLLFRKGSDAAFNPLIDKVSKCCVNVIIGIGIHHNDLPRALLRDLKYRVCVSFGIRVG